MAPPQEPASVFAGNAATPRDYSEDLYRFYLEVADPNGAVYTALCEYLGSNKAASLSAMPEGYAFDMPIQCAPEVVRTLSQASVAIYQLVRLGRVDGDWRDRKAP